MLSLICARNNSWTNNGDAGDLRRNLAHYDIIVTRLILSKRSAQGNWSIPRLQIWSWYFIIFYSHHIALLLKMITTGTKVLFQKGNISYLMWSISLLCISKWVENHVNIILEDLVGFTSIKYYVTICISRSILGMSSANERRRYNVTSTLIGWAQVRDYPW